MLVVALRGRVINLGAWRYMRGKNKGGSLIVRMPCGHHCFISKDDQDLVLFIALFNNQISNTRKSKFWYFTCILIDWNIFPIFKKIFIFVQVQFSAFPHYHSPLPQPSPPPSPDSTHPWCCPCVLYSCFWKPFTLSTSLSPPVSPLVTVCLVLISMSLVIFCLLVCFVD